MTLRRSNQILVIGGNDAGLSAAGRAKRLNPSLDITVLERSANSAYASCGLPLLISGEAGAAHLAGPSIDELQKERGVRILTRHEALEINPVKRLAVVRDLQNGTTLEFPYGKLVLATGSRVRRPEWAREPAENLFSLRTFNDADRLNSYLNQSAVKEAMVVGAGFVGLEIAEALQKRGLRVILLEQEHRPFLPWDEAIVAPLLDALKRQGIETRFSCQISEAQRENNRIRTLKLVDQPDMATDLVFLATGIDPDIDLATAAHIPLGKSGAIRVNSRQQTERMNIYAVGDCSESKHTLTQKPVWAPFAGVASKQGRVAGSHIGGKADAFPGVLGTALVRAFGIEMGVTGLTESQALAAGFQPQTTVITHPDRSEYIPGGHPLTVALMTDKKSKKLLGAQLVGAPGSGHRLNILATALTAGMTAHQLAYLDLGYIPQLSPVWDPVLISARVASQSPKRTLKD